MLHVLKSLFLYNYIYKLHFSMLYTMCTKYHMFFLLLLLHVQYIWNRISFASKFRMKNTVAILKKWKKIIFFISLFAQFAQIFKLISPSITQIHWNKKLLSPFKFYTKTVKRPWATKYLQISVLVDSEPGFLKMSDYTIVEKRITNMMWSLIFN